MKLNFKTEVRSQKPEARSRTSGNLPPSAFCLRTSQRGVALIITLILLSVTLVMALAFLAISGRERGAVTTQTDTTTTRLAADAGLAAAEAQIAVNILSATNPYSFGLLVSTNYAPYLPPFTAQYLGTNLQYSPRAPVAIPNPTNPSAPLDFRFYLDLNRNGMDDPNGRVTNYDNNGNSLGTVSFQVGDPEWIGVLEHPDQPYGPNNPFTARFAFIALPVGNSLDLNAIHNQALSQAASQKGTTAINPFPLGTGDTYFRNQGVGSWELNLAAFLADLNSDEWAAITAPYNYNEPANNNVGAAFDDARALLAYRYYNNYHTLTPVVNLFDGGGTAALASDNIDVYSIGPLMTGTQSPGYNESGDVNNFWLGADNTNHFFTPEELFDPTKTEIGVTAPVPGFIERLQQAGTNNSTYDRYTFYRMLSQLGTDTTPESGKMNLNYDNLVQAGTNGVVSETNFIAWQPLVFFTNAADRMLKAYTTRWFQSGPSSFLATYYGINGYNYYYQDASGNTYTNDPGGFGLTNVPFFGMTNQIPAFGVTGIPVLVGSQFVYTPAVQRVLQLAANIYDATTNSYYPSVFRPLFTSNSFGVFVTGYTNIAPMSNPATDPQMDLPVDAVNVSGVNTATNVYGVPWIIGAKKGFPNFNAFTLENVFSVTRKLQVTRGHTNDYYWQNPCPDTFSQQLTLGITNLLGVECWNSYQADHTNGIVIYVSDTSATFLTNDEGTMPAMPSGSGIVYTNSFFVANNPPFAVPDWPGYGVGTIPQQSSFIIPFTQYEPVLGLSIYTFNPSTPFVLPSQTYFVTNNLMPHWGLQLTNRLRVVMVESNAADGFYHIIDYAQLIGPDSSHDLTADIQKLYDSKNSAPIIQNGPGFNGYDNQWDATTNSQGVPNGIANQIDVSAQLDPIILSPYWSQQSPIDVTNKTAGFRAFLGFGRLPGMPPSVAQYIAVGATSLAQQAPYTPTAVVVYQTQWEANDPLVHYLASDLTDFNISTAATETPNAVTFTGLNDHYWPWGGNPQKPTDPNPYNHTIKDPLVWSSDFWNFPANKFPTAGWLGRVHRGTPWQTVYLKSSDVPSTTVLVAIGTNSIYLPMWQYLTGNLNSFDATNTAPVQDRLLFDLFTTAFNDNATRGTLSVNQSAGSSDPAAGLAAWSALFSGMVVLPSQTNYTVIAPVGGLAISNSALGILVTNINYARNNFTNADGLVGVFEHKGDILSVPQLTDQSPFLTGLNPTNAISDAMYEWLPQQAMSLLRVGTPRYVIYSYGQSLKPAPGGVYLGAGPYFNMVTNYQVVSEVATRAVVRLDTVRTNANGAIILTPPRAVIESFNLLPPD
jgi:hypothetical protein